MGYVASFRPLCSTRAGMLAAAKYDLPPYIDGSCRREPDLQSTRPSISALCRFKQFAPRLDRNDEIAYLTVKGAYGGMARHRRLVAYLKVVRRFDSHETAADWYRKRGLPVPSNCIVAGSNTQPLDKTLADLPRTKRAAQEILLSWDAGYRQRASECSVFLACKVLFLDLYDPPVVSDAVLENCFQEIPATRNPGARSIATLRRLLAWARKQRAGARNRQPTVLTQRSTGTARRPACLPANARPVVPRC